MPTRTPFCGAQGSGTRKNSDRPATAPELLQFPLREAASVAALAVVVLLAGPPARGQEDADKSASAAKKPSTAEAAAELTLAQERVEEKYREFEKVLARMAELTAATDPKRAALLRKAVAQSKEELIGTQFEKLVELLKQKQLANAVGNQRE